MVSLAQLWLPILLSAVFVFLASSVIHMAFTYHNKEYHGLGNEDEVRAVLRKANAAPGLYFLGYRNPITGQLHDIAEEALRIADLVARRPS